MLNKLRFRLTAILLLIIMTASLALTIARFTGEQGDQSENNKLTLTTLADGSWFSGAEGYFTEKFSGRRYLVKAKGEFDSRFGESIVNGVYTAPNMLIDSQPPVIASAEKTAELINQFSSSGKGTAHIAVIPSSAAVYNDKLPKYLQSMAEKQQIDDYYMSLNSNIRRIDAYNILKMLNTEYIYYRNDSRWTSYGAYCVYRTLIQKLGFQPTAYDKYTIEHVTGEFRGDLFERTQYSRLKADILDIYTCADGAEAICCIGYRNDGTFFETQLYDERCLASDDMYRLYLSEQIPLIRVETNVNNDRKLLVIKDEYANCFIPFLVQHYSEIAVVSPEYLETGLSDLIVPDDYEQTLFLFGSDGFSDTNGLELINE